MDENNSNDINIEAVKAIFNSAPLVQKLSDLYTSSLTNRCLEDAGYYNECRLTPKLISNDIAKKLHEAVALGGESVKRYLELWYSDPNVIETMTALVDTCVAYIGEEVTAILRKYSNI